VIFHPWGWSLYIVKADKRFLEDRRTKTPIIQEDKISDMGNKDPLVVAMASYTTYPRLQDYYEHSNRISQRGLTSYGYMSRVFVSDKANAAGNIAWNWFIATMINNARRHPNDETLQGATEYTLPSMAKSHGLYGVFDSAPISALNTFYALYNHGTWDIEDTATNEKRKTLFRKQVAIALQTIRSSDQLRVRDLVK
jgi:hypothetical protein